jgi:protein-tyrosine phosphatase
MEENETNKNGQSFRPYEEELQKLSLTAGHDIKFCRLPIKDLTTPTKGQMKHILDVIDSAMEDRIVYLHCWGGNGRTGTVVGCYLVRHDIVSGQEALEFLQGLRHGLETADRPSPETDEQIDMVRRWKAGQ